MTITIRGEQEVQKINSFGIKTTVTEVVSLRKITPSKDFVGFTSAGKPINHEILKLCKDLEPTATSFYLS